MAHEACGSDVNDQNDLYVRNLFNS